jgi:Carboxypeptidase regulatory-like domain/Putative Ig domain
MISKTHLPAKTRLNISLFTLFFFVVCFSTTLFAVSSLTPASGVLPNGTVGQAYNLSFVPSTNNGWTCVRSTNWVNVTNGLTLNASTGILSGSPVTSPRTYNFTVTVNCSNPAGNQNEIVTNNYTLNIVTVSAAGTRVTGRVVDLAGRGIFRAKVSIFDTNTGESYFASTNPFGYFRFQDIESGDFCIMDIQSKRYNFTGISFIANENLEDLIIMPNN